METIETIIGELENLQDKARFNNAALLMFSVAFQNPNSEPSPSNAADALAGVNFAFDDIIKRQDELYLKLSQIISQKGCEIR